MKEKLQRALDFRSPFIDPKHQNAFRLFNGFVEGDPEFVIDVYGKTAVLHWYGKRDFHDASKKVDSIFEWIQNALPWMEAHLLKQRFSKIANERNGVYVSGKKKTTWIHENGVRYSTDLTMNRDASFYLDTRSLRRWILENVKGRSVLNTFAYTGSLGVAAVAGGATRVVQTDLNKAFLNVAKTSYTLNGFTIKKCDFQTGDFWKHMNALKRKGDRFDWVIVDPPFFSETKGGKVDLSQSTKSLINKVRPLVKSGGKIIYINNALFVSGAQLETELNDLCDEWLFFEKRIDIDSDFSVRSDRAKVDPMPYNHSTKITILGIQHRN